MTRSSRFFISVDKSRQVSALLCKPRSPIGLYVLAHSAGAGMEHPFMEHMAAALYDRKVATLRYQFPYMESGSRRPDGKNLLFATVRAALGEARRHCKGVALLAGGKSMGGRMTSMAMAEIAERDVAGLIFLGFPLHPPGKDGSERAVHLSSVKVPMLFVQGTRDKLAELDRMTKVVKGLGRHGVMHVVEGGDHSFKVLKRSGRKDADVIAEIGDTVRDFIENLGESR